jgi:hypothetical protein
MATLRRDVGRAPGPPRFDALGASIAGLEPGSEPEDVERSTGTTPTELPGRRRPPGLLLGAATVAAIALVGGVVLGVRSGPPPEPPTALAAVVYLDAAPEHLTWNREETSEIWFRDGESLIGLTGCCTPADWSLRGSDVDMDGVDAVTRGVVGSMAWDTVAAYRDGRVVLTELGEDDSRMVQVPAHDRALGFSAVIATNESWGRSYHAFVFPVDENGRTASMLAVEFNSGTVSEVALPVEGTVRDAVSYGMTVFVALDSVLVAVGGDLDDSSCWVQHGVWELPASALWLASWPVPGEDVVLPRLLALDPAAASVTAFEPFGGVTVDGGCRAMRSPDPLGSVDLRSAAGRDLVLGPSLVAVDEVAYVLTTDDELVMVDVAEPTLVRDDRYLGTVPGLDGAHGADNRLAVHRSWREGTAHVLVAAPEHGAFWVIGEADGSTSVETVHLREGVS